MKVRVWSPPTSRARVRTREGDIELSRDGEWWTGPELAPGTDYAFLLDDSDDELPDPASRWQPDGVHGWSRVYDDRAHFWRDDAWAGRDLTAAVIYELHIGTFTRGATFDSAIERLDHLVWLGITHVEVMPINGVNGIWNWGYDGVAWYAVHEPYGGPDGFKRFVEACHVRGLAVLLDVVYNHLGPSGNYLPRFGPYLKTGRNTWGDLVNLEEPAVRRFVIDNALMWLRDFHVDGLRLDAVHALVDSSGQHVLAAMSEEVEALSRSLGRPLSLIAESDLNDPVMIDPRPEGHGLAAQWDDDVHHALHSALTGETHGYYCDFGSLDALAKVFTSGFVHDGTYSTFRGKLHGRPIDPDRHDGTQLVASLQNHDQVGNRAAGERLGELCTTELLRAGAVLLLTSPFTPMLWMGEEWGARTRWPFFTSHPEPELAESTGAGRLAEFARFGWAVESMPDPQDPRTYHGAVLDWDERHLPDRAATLDLYRRLLSLRAELPDLRDPDFRKVVLRYDDVRRWFAVERGEFLVVANLSAEWVSVPMAAEELVLTTGEVTWGDEIGLAPQSAAILRRTERVEQVAHQLAREARPSA